MTSQNPEHLVADALGGYVYRAWMSQNGMLYVFTMKRSPEGPSPHEDALHKHAAEMMRSVPFYYLVPDISLEQIFAGDVAFPEGKQSLVWFCNGDSRTLEMFGNTGARTQAQQARLAGAFHGTLVG